MGVIDYAKGHHEGGSYHVEGGSDRFEGGSYHVEGSYHGGQVLQGGFRPCQGRLSVYTAKLGELHMGPGSETLLTPVTASPAVSGAISTVYYLFSTVYCLLSTVYYPPGKYFDNQLVFAV